MSSGHHEDSRIEPPHARHELVVTDSAVPLVRVGYSNILLFIGIVAGIFFTAVTQGAGVPGPWSVLVGAGAFAFFVTRYARSFSRLSVDTECLEFTCALHTARLDIREVAFVRLAQVGTSMTGIVAVKKRGHFLSESFFYVSPATNWGDVAQTLDRLRSLLEAQDVVVKEARLIHREVGPRK